MADFNSNRDHTNYPIIFLEASLIPWHGQSAIPIGLSEIFHDLITILNWSTPSETWKKCIIIYAPPTIKPLNPHSNSQVNLDIGALRSVHCYTSRLITSIKTARKLGAVSWWNFEEACKSGGNGNFNQKKIKGILIKITVSSFA